MKIKRVVSLLLAFAVLLGGIPFIGLDALKVQAAPTTDYDINDAAKEITINTAAGWTYFAGISRSGVPGKIEANCTGWTIKLTENINITSAVIPSADDFSGVFDGQNHTITLPAGDSYFANDNTAALGGDVGLFRNVAGNGGVNNLIVRLNKGSTLYVTRLLKGCNQASDITSFGAVIGRLSDNAKMKNCALVGGGQIIYRNNKGAQMAYYNTSVRVGSMVGEIANQASAENCYSDVNVKAWAFSINPNTNDSMLALQVGGLFGGIDSNVNSKNCIGINQQIEASNFSTNVDYMYVGGIVGACYGIENSYAKGSAISVRQTNVGHSSSSQVDELPGIPGKGVVSAIGYSKNRTIVNCAANTTFSVDSNGSVVFNEGYVGNIDAITAERMGAEWVNTNQKIPNLKWIVNMGPQSATIDTTVKTQGSLIIDKSYAELNTVADYQEDGDAKWGFTMTLPIKGRVEPFNGNVTMAVVDDGKTPPTITQKTLTFPVVPNAKLYYKCADTQDTSAFTSINQLTDAAYKPYDKPVVLKEPAELAAKFLFVIAAPEDSSTKIPSTITRYNLQTTVPTGKTDVDLNRENTAGAGYAPKTVSTGTLYYTKDATLGGALPETTTPLTLDAIMGTVDGIYLNNAVDYVAAGSRSVNVFAAKDRFGGDGASSRFVATAAIGSVQGNVSPRPTISPRGTGIISNGVTINIPVGTKVFYTWVVNPLPGSPPVHPELKPDGTSKDPAITKEYTANTVLPFPEKATKLVVRAIAYEIGKTVSDEDYVEYSNDANLPLPYAPNLLVAGVDHSDAATYPDASEIKFTHTNLAEGLVYFTVNSSVPSGSNANAYRYGKGQEYDETKPFRLPTIGGRDFIEVKAVFHSDKTLLDSPVSTYRVHTKQMLKAPAASIPTGKRVPPGQPLLLSLSNAAISQLNTTSKISAARITYSDGKDGKPATDDASFTVDTTNPPVNGTEYISYNVDQNNETYSLPTIRYKLGAGAVDIDKTGAICQYGQRRVLSKTVNGVQTVTVSYINPEPIVLTGEADKAITVSAMALSELEAYSSSAVASFEYTIFAACAKPTAIPATTDTAFTMLAPGSFINLASATANTSIYYTVNNSMPVVQDYLDWVTNGSLPANKPATMLYDDATAIVMPNKANAIFTIRTIVHSNDNTFVDSGVTQFTYQMPAQVNAVYVSPSQGSVVTGTTVQLKCATPDAKIFYRTFASKPDMAVPENIPKPYKDQIFDAASPLVITKNIWIVALAEKNGMTSIPTMYEYTIAPLTTEPTASLKTGSVVNRGTRIRLSGAGNIAFTMDGSDPKAAVAAMQTPSGGAKADAPAKAAEVFFGDSFVVDAEFGKSVTVRAFTYGDGKTPSNVVSFTYTVCEKDSYITAVPQNGSVVTSADQITLATTISDGKIFYSTGIDTPVLVNRYADAAIDAAENEPYTHYQWIAGANTIQGTSLKISGAAGSTVTVKAVACANGSEGGATQVFTYKIRDKTAAPTASIPNGAVTLEGATVVLSAREGDIFFTTDGTKPSTSSRLYTEPIEVPGSMVLKAIAVAKDKTESDVVEYHYSYADQAFAPEMSIPSGEIEQGKLLTLTSKTENASIYYTTNGAEPTEKSTLYTAPINIMRPVTIKAIAIYKGLRNSAVNSASYTVIEPPPPQTENGTDGKPQGPLNSLVSRRTYFDETVGPKFSAFIARDNATNTVISANDGIVPKGAKLVVKRVDTSDSDREAVRTSLGNEVVVLYDVSLEKDGEKVEPSGEVELGITIPEEYQNSLVTVCRIGADNTVEEYEPRRSGTAAYFLVSGKLDRYAVTIPEELAVSGGKLSTMSIVLLGLAAIVALSMCAGAVTFLIIRRRSRISESDLPLEQEENLEDFFSDELHNTDNSQPTQNEDENNS